ncbi:hypothetical protein SAMN04487944_104172 [Gracilibacillus ureilyticus]|uniref:Gas vesicle protein n=1 Tax=Gracilibacillus ureilyticus TaxID=531814 RepID=A0A1H9PAM3_9BACI|nr:hypothetical protein [Gracilibacillus ureilyticus]SER45202.1 hypothetical protein SAMN04487944_104172 [Gracilibacillus ureilyticus]
MKVEETQNSDEQTSGQNSITYVLLGGMAGAGIGMLSNPGTVQKLYHRVQQSETGQRIAKELGKNLQHVITQQAMTAVQQAAPDYWNKAKSKISKSSSSEPDRDKMEIDTNYEEIKQENEQINQRLEKIEQMLDKLVHEKN